MKTPLLLAAVALGFASVATAVPEAGRSMPSVSVNDLSGDRHTERDLSGQWTVVFAMTDKDCGEQVSQWFQRVHALVPASTRFLTFVAIDLFPLIPTATVLSQARNRTPRDAWHTVWFSRDGSFADQLGLPESETPWVFVVNPEGQVVASLHADTDAHGAARVAAAVGR